MDLKPNLIEPGTKFFLRNTLTQCKNFRDKYINLLYNILLILMFFIILVVILYTRFKGNISPEEKQKKIRKEKEYIYSKLRQYNDFKQKQSNNLITNLPESDWSNNPESLILNRKIY